MNSDRLWYESPTWKSRLALEDAVMAERFPHFALRKDTDGRLFWAGVVQPVRGEYFAITLTYPHTYPYSEPELRVLQPTIRPGTGHLYGDGRLCIHRKGSWNPQRGTAAISVGLACAWLASYVHWDRTGEGF